MRLHSLLTLHLIWLSVLFAAPLQAVAQEQDSAGINIVVPADSVLPGQKNPFTDAQRLEASDKRFLRRAVLPSAVLIAAGIYTYGGRGLLSSNDVFDYRNRTFPDFGTDADDFAMFAPLVGLYGFNLISPLNRHKLSRQTILFLSAVGITSGIVGPTKLIANIERPSGEPYAFPSGHTAYAFTIATFMDKEFRHTSPWISVVSYGIAGGTGVLRVLNNEHWMSDVLAGAGVGILSVNMVYWVHAKLTEGGGLKTSVVPVVLPNGSPGVGMYMQF
ncbi:PAP2 family protein [Pontibacter diazotrophicus]|uniref:PAP2 family protein n=1 Tax=Pontibacter diazotrophicus TaxID=1400979 RepID=A0A3D8LDN6_9BACT|nr:phosphatase PAP2 family protein [Pontibacter diazotrophicus]RDV15515.1 PAP2 family protein [Pontibacter diazotrophicus]